MITKWNQRLLHRFAKMQVLACGRDMTTERQAVMVWRRARRTRPVALFVSGSSGATTLPPAPPSPA